jgi:hypothetical protein
MGSDAYLTRPALLADSWEQYVAWSMQMAEATAVFCQQAQ